VPTESDTNQEIAQRTLDSGPIAISLFAPDGALVQVNDSWERMYGWTLREVTERRIDVLAETSADPHERVRGLAFVRAATGEWECFKQRDRSGRRMDVRVAVMALADDTRVILAQEVTDWKRAEDALRESEHRLQEAARLAQLGYWDYDLVADRITCSEEACRILGVPAGSVLRQAQFQAMVHPEDQEGEREVLAHSLHGGPPYDHTYRIVRPDGEVRSLHVWDEMVRDAVGKPTRMFGTVQDITERRREEQERQLSAERLRTLSRRLLEVQESERRHLARELHDEVGQLLTGLRLQLRAEGKADDAREQIRQARQIVDQLLAEVRGLSFALRPAVLDQLGLLPALLALFEWYTDRTGVSVEFKHAGVEGRFRAEVETAAYRTVQEALTNAARHAGVLNATARAWADGSVLGVQVEDAGRGFDASTMPTDAASTGLRGMEERVMLLGGTLSIESRPGKGTTITAELPLQEHIGGRGPAGAGQE
jgi:PAS domain S-box-containing protein